MTISYQSQAMQDKFVSNLYNFKPNGFFLDIGSCHAVSTNNSYALECRGWKGICIEMDPQHNESYSQRSCKFINEDATKIDYEALFYENNVPGFIDYISLDVDATSTEVLKRLPLDKYKFGIMTIEHDYYIHNGIYRDEQRKILWNRGYTLMCSDVLVPLQDDTKPNSSFEDWWVNPDIISVYDGKRISCERNYPNEIIAKFN